MKTSSPLRMFGLGLLAAFAVATAALQLLADEWRDLNPAPGGRASHSAIWTGEEMIVWGGGIDGRVLNTGGRLNIRENQWRPTTVEGAPSPRWFQVAVWTGKEMIVWGGRGSFYMESNYGDGAIYDPSTDTWRPMSIAGAPSARSQCAAVWTGRELLVWGGVADGATPLNDGARYNPETDEWKPMATPFFLAPRLEPTAVWTGTELITFGGVDPLEPGWLSFGDGGRYDPVTDSWTALPASRAPSSRTAHTAVWTGDRMILWGGRELPDYRFLADGASYDPALNRWTPLSNHGAPQARMLHAAVWTGSEMLVWGGQTAIESEMTSTGGRYDPATGIWRPMTMLDAPESRMFWRPDLGIWTGEAMLISCGSLYPWSLESTALYYPGETPPGPVITRQPKDRTVFAGSFAMFTVKAVGESKLTYQWTFNDLPIKGAIRPYLWFKSVRRSDAGEYRVIVSDKTGTITSEPARLTLKDKYPRWKRDNRHTGN